MKLNFPPRISSRLTLMVSAMVVAIVFASCREREFKVKGEIEGAPETSVVIEKSDYRGAWQALDSTRTSPSGKFSISMAAPGAPEVYRLKIGSAYVYLPIDSTETITVGGRMPGLALNYTLEGSEQAVKMAEFDHQLSAEAASGKSLDDFKKRVFQTYIRDSRGSLLSFYVLTKTVGDRLLFDPANQDDLRYYAAVATAFKEFNPTDPRVKYLEETTIRALRERNTRKGRANVVEAQELKAIDITLPGTDGKERTLSSLLGNGKRTLLVFSMLSHPDAPLVNREIAKHYAGGAINVYQVSIGDDRYAWRDAAANLPWTNVFDTEGERSSTALKYNVSRLPAFFLYNAAGELIDRADDLDALDRMMKK